MSNSWAYVRIGKIVGLLQPDVYALFLQEYERLAKLVDSRKVTPVLGAMILNSAMTPTESLV